MKIAPLALALSLLTATANAQPFAMVGAETLCRGTLPNITDLDCTGVVDDAGWSSALSWCPEPEGSRLIVIGWMGAEVSTFASDGSDDVLLGYLPESHKMGAAQSACDAAGIVYYTLTDGTLWRFDPDACGDLACSPAMVGLVLTEGGDPVDTIGGDLSFDQQGRLWMIGDIGLASRMYRIDHETGQAALVSDPITPSPAWGMAAADVGLVAFTDDLHAYALPGAVDLGLVGYDWPQEHGDAASEVAFSCELEVEVGPESPRRAMFGADEPRLEARIRVLHVRPKTVDTRLRWWLEQDGRRISPIAIESLTLDYMDSYGWKGLIPLPAESGNYRLVAEVARMGQGVARSFADFEVH